MVNELSSWLSDWKTPALLTVNLFFLLWQSVIFPRWRLQCLPSYLFIRCDLDISLTEWWGPVPLSLESGWVFGNVLNIEYGKCRAFLAHQLLEPSPYALKQPMESPSWRETKAPSPRSSWASRQWPALISQPRERSIQEVNPPDFFAVISSCCWHTVVSVSWVLTISELGSTLFCFIAKQDYLLSESYWLKLQNLSHHKRFHLVH